MSANKSAMKLPENIKPVGEKKTTAVKTYDENFNVPIMSSISWLGVTTSAIGFATISWNDMLMLLPVGISILTFFPLFFLGLEIFVGGAIGGYQRVFKKLDTPSPRMATQQAMQQSGMTFSRWTKKGLKSAHVLLPFRMFRKVKVHELVTYFPVQDKYVKQTYYLNFSRCIKVEETFEGQRAVFQKAIDTF